MEGFDGPPESYLPRIEPVNEIDQEIMDQLKIMGFIHSVENAATELLSAESTQLVVTYSLLLSQKRERLAKEDAENEAKRLKKEQDRLKKEMEDVDRRDKERREREFLVPASPRRGSITSGLPTISEGRKSKKHEKHASGSGDKEGSNGKDAAAAAATAAAITAAGATPTKPSPMSSSKKSKKPEEPDPKLKKAHSNKQSPESPSKERKVKPMPALGANPPSVAAAVMDRKGDGGGRSRSRSIATSQPPSMGQGGNHQNPPVIKAPSTPEPPSRIRSASVSQGPARPVFSIEDIESGKIKIPTPTKDGKAKKNQFKEQQIAKKPSKDGEKRPSIVDANFFAPPRSGTPKPPPELTDADNSVTIAETTSKKPAEEILAEVKRVLSLLRANVKEGPSPFSLKCSYEIEGELVRIQVEVVNVVKNTDLRGIAIKRTGGDIWAYKKLYSAIILELKL